jgi:hypothetical protein
MHSDSIDMYVCTFIGLDRHKCIDVKSTRFQGAAQSLRQRGMIITSSSDILFSAQLLYTHIER